MESGFKTIVWDFIKQISKQLMSGEPDLHLF